MNSKFQSTKHFGSLDVRNWKRHTGTNVEVRLSSKDTSPVVNIKHTDPGGTESGLWWGNTSTSVHLRCGDAIAERDNIHNVQKTTITLTLACWKANELKQTWVVRHCIVVLSLELYTPFEYIGSKLWLYIFANNLKHVERLLIIVTWVGK